MISIPKSRWDKLLSELRKTRSELGQAKREKATLKVKNLELEKFISRSDQHIYKYSQSIS